MRHWTLILLLLVGFTPLVSQAQTTGNQAAVWLRIPTDTRMAAMAESGCAIVNSAAALDVNPAGLAWITYPQLTLSNNFWIYGVIMEHGSFGTNLDQGGLAFTADYLNVGTIQGEQAVGSSTVATGGITPYGLDCSGGYGFHLTKELSAGFSAKYFGQSLGTPLESGFSGNAGIMYKNRNGLSVGLSLLNAGPQLDGFSLPLQASFGVGYHFDMADQPTLGPMPHQLTFSGECDYYPDSLVAEYSLGAEYVYRRMLSVRVGYHFANYGDDTGIGGFAAGLGFLIDQFDISAAYSVVGTAGTSIQVALAMRL